MVHYIVEVAQIVINVLKIENYQHFHSFIPYKIVQHNFVKVLEKIHPTLMKTGVGHEDPWLHL